MTFSLLVVVEPVQCKSRPSRISAIAPTRRLVPHRPARSSHLELQARAQIRFFSSTGIRAVPTYEAVGLLLVEPGRTRGPERREVRSPAQRVSRRVRILVRHRATTSAASLVNLSPAPLTTKRSFSLPARGFTRGITFTTWSNRLPVSKVIAGPAGPFDAQHHRGGSASGYVVYDARAGRSTRPNASQSTSPSRVVRDRRGLTLERRASGRDPHRGDVHDVLARNNDITAGPPPRRTWGTDIDSAFRAHIQNE